MNIYELPQLTALYIQQKSCRGVENIGNLKRLTYLNVVGNDLGDEGAKYLGDAGAKYITEMKQLVSLTITGNDIGPKYLSELSHLTTRVYVNNEEPHEGNNRILIGLNVVKNCFNKV